MKRTIPILCAACLAACAPCRRLPQPTLATTDTVTITERLRDTVVVVQKDEALLRALVACDSLGEVRLREVIELRSGERMRPPELTIEDNILNIKATADSMAIYLTLRDRLEERSLRREEVRIVEVNRLNGWQRFWMRFGQAAAGLSLAWVGLRVGRRLRP